MVNLHVASVVEKKEDAKHICEPSTGPSYQYKQTRRANTVRMQSPEAY